MASLKASTRVFPGDDLTAAVTKLHSSKGGTIDIGNGLRLQKGNRIVCTCAGTLEHRPPSHFYILEKHRKQYYPKVGDQIVGVIEDRGGDFFRVNIFSGVPAIMSRLAFDGATKRNRPELRKGDILYCQVASAQPDVDVELTCMSSAVGFKKDWSSGEAIYQGLGEGLICHTSISFAEKLLLPDCPLLNHLGARLSFEIAIGVNGAIWINGNTIADIIMIKNIIENAQTLADSPESQIALVDYLAENSVKR